MWTSIMGKALLKLNKDEHQCLGLCLLKASLNCCTCKAVMFPFGWGQKGESGKYYCTSCLPKDLQAALRSSLTKKQSTSSLQSTKVVAQHCWFTIPLWLYQIGAIDKRQLMDFCNLPTMCQWMEANWSKWAPKQLFSNYSSATPGDMEKHKEVLNSINCPPPHLAIHHKVPAVPSMPDTWGDLPHSAKTSYIARWVQCTFNEGRKLAVFGQHLHTFAILRHQLHKQHLCNLNILEVSGHIPTEKHAKQLTQFLSLTLPGMLLLSTNMCTMGINLQQVTELIFIKLSWNPATDHQAMCCAWRLGQQQGVKVAHLLMQTTINQHVTNTIDAHNSKALRFDSNIRISHHNPSNHQFHVCLTKWAQMSHTWVRAHEDHKHRYVVDFAARTDELQNGTTEHLFDTEGAAV
ncbi:helicase conserved Cterminal domain containing protein [Acanthamoeba castellanii str. Neff]|uniref:Helicase conserved Cterminal domain containing protein n=1 Tax=Acanthamoeba castellanii (strain ATCC 30010 / Neff) TaxID=1257118 RepID=L8GDR7_ACACF|nr:helicase conserved Cterminal domain containing protein [Acanthamoeba castellanii str. Neff]ELR10863.1 helicase conserved Cterminal domain containing protein [Acanthamoeba castellanii str. Neff]